MILNYFDYEGKKYYTGTIIVVSRYPNNEEAVFVCRNPEKNWYVYRVRQCNNIVGKEDFYNRLVAVTDKVNSNVRPPEEKIAKDSEIPGLSYGWAIYIGLMLFASIFNENVGLWILISVVFFSWRKKKRGDGKYIEWH